MSEIRPSDRLFVGPEAADIEEFAALCARETDPALYPHSSAVQKNVVIYDGQALLADLQRDKPAVQKEMHDLLRNGPGVLVVSGAYADLAVVDRHTEVFERIFEAEARQGIASDHFAKAGANGRIWNSLQKSAELSPESFIEYYANPLIGLVAEAWLGPHYQLTTQVNVVRPGGQAQQAHCDYHLGFQSVEEVARYPVPLHTLSKSLTLQCAVAHSDMPVETGPTLLLPFSQQYELGYLAWRRADFIDHFQRHAVQLPLSKGDIVFFNPGLFHAAGTNRTTDRQRIANLLQISVAFGKPMESVDRDAMSLALYPALSRIVAQKKLDEVNLRAVVAAVADGYSFPTNLDTDPPLQDLAPQTAQQFIWQALQEGYSFERFSEGVLDMQRRRQAKSFDKLSH